MVVACIALLVALAGTSVAAVKIVVPRNSVGALQLKPNSVNTSKVRNGSLLEDRLQVGPAALPVPGRPRRPGMSGGPCRPCRRDRSCWCCVLRVTSR